MRDWRMRTERLRGDGRERRFLQAGVTGFTAVHCAELRKPYLPNAALKSPLQGYGIGAHSHQLEIAFLVMAPFAEMILRGCDGQAQQQQHADCAEGASAVTEDRSAKRIEFLPYRHVCP